MARPSRQRSNLRAYLVFGEAQFVELLQIHPELRRRAEPMPETQRRIGGDPAVTMNDTGNPVHGHVDLTRKFRCADAELAQFFARCSPGWMGLRGMIVFPQW